MKPISIESFLRSTGEERDSACRALAGACGRGDLSDAFSAPTWFAQDRLATCSDEEAMAMKGSRREYRQWCLGLPGGLIIIFHDLPEGADQGAPGGALESIEASRVSWVRVPGIHNHFSPYHAFLTTYDAVRRSISDPPSAPSGWPDRLRQHRDINPDTTESA